MKKFEDYFEGILDVLVEFVVEKVKGEFVILIVLFLKIEVLYEELKVVLVELLEIVLVKDVVVYVVEWFLVFCCEVYELVF